MHTWLADATEKATPGTSVLLVCVLDKIGTYAMLRFCLGLFPDASQWATPFVVTLALISIVYGALVAIGQDDMLRLIGLTSLSHFGFIVLGIFVFTSQGTSGSILYMVNHGVATAALFLARRLPRPPQGHRSISAITGVEKSAPILAGVFLVAGLAVLGLPGLSQFVSEIMVIIAAFQHHWWVGAIAVSAIVLAAWYILWMYQRTFTGPGVTGVEPVADLDRREVGTLAPLVVALVLFGFYPMPLLDVINPAATTILQNVGVQIPRPPSAEPREATDMDDFVKPTLEYAELSPLFIVFGIACLGVLVEAFVPRRHRYLVQSTLAIGGVILTLAAVVAVAYRLETMTGPPAASSARWARSSSTARASSCGG